MDTTYGYNKDIHKSKIIKYKRNNLATMNTFNTNINIILNREENHLSIHDSYLEKSLLSQIMMMVYLLMMLISD